MSTLSLTSACYRASVKDGETGLQRAFNALWEHLRSVVDDLDPPKDGIHQFQRFLAWHTKDKLDAFIL